MNWAQMRSKLLRGVLLTCATSLLWGQLQIPTKLPRLPGRGSKKDPADKKTNPKEILSNFNGTIRSITADTISLDAADTRIVNFKTSKNTKYTFKDQEVQGSALKPGDEVRVEARKDDEGFFYAVNVLLQKAAPEAVVATPKVQTTPDEQSEKPKASDKETPVEPEARTPAVLRPPVPVTDPDDAGPPTLRRGKPAPQPGKPRSETARLDPPAPTETPAPAPTTAREAPVVEVAADGTTVTPANRNSPNDFIEKVRETAFNFSESLPNYICQQMTTRYQSETRTPSWNAKDVVSAEVVYDNGKESYRNIKINNKLVNKPMEEIPGGWSRGEFGSTLRDLFSPATAGDFRYRRDSMAAGLPSAVYDFSVERKNSHWETRIGGQAIFPAYKGSVWIDKKSMRVLRIEMQARSIPEEFPLNTVEWVVDYEFVRIGTQQFLLPVHAENLSCWRGSFTCARNTINFRNYRKFTSESQIMTTDSAISFDGEEAPAKAPAKPAEKKK